MTQPAKSQEPSMEEILASIRRIIADDDANKSAPRPAEPPPQAVAPAPAARPTPPPQFRTIDGSFDVSYEEEKSAPQMPMPAPPMPEPLPRAEERGHQLLSSVTSAAVDSAFNTLAQTVLVQNA